MRMRCLAPMLLTLTIAIAPVARGQDDHVCTSDLVTRWGEEMMPMALSDHAAPRFPPSPATE